MSSYDLDKMISACELEDVLQAGNNITITKIDDCTLEISSTGGGTANGIKYHLKDGDDITVQDCFQYAIECDFIMDTNSNMTVDAGGQLVIEDGCLILDGCLALDGCLKFK